MASTSSMTAAVYSRVSHDAPFVAAFADWYLNRLGFDRMVLLQSDGGNASFLMPDARLEVYAVPSHGINANLDRYKNLVLRRFDWVLTVDSDEFLLLAPRYPSIHSFIKEKQAAESLPIDLIQFRWAQIDRLVTFCDEATFPALVGRSLAYRNHFVKTMSRASSVVSFNHTHYPAGSVPRLRTYFEGRTDSRRPGSNFNFSEHTYRESALVHVQTRSLANLLQKSLFTNYNHKRMGNVSAFVDFVRGPPDLHKTDAFIQLVGLKAFLAFSDEEAHREEASLAAFVEPLASPAISLPPFCNASRERAEAATAFAEQGIRLSDYELMADAVLLSSNTGSGTPPHQSNNVVHKRAAPQAQ